MSVFEKIGEILKNLFGINGNGWVIRKNASTENIETYNGEAHEDETSRTCALCVALNDTIFRNDNKPDYYHLHCKCKNISTTLSEPTLLFSMKKITNYLFIDENKSKMMKSMGYNPSDYQELYDKISENVKKNFVDGNYKLKTLNINGQKFEINYIITGKNEHIAEVFNCHTGCVAWPNGKIKIATPIIKD